MRGYSQGIIKDTIYVNDDSFDAPIFFSARDSIFSDLKNEKIHLYGEAIVNDGTINMKACYIMIDLQQNEIFATHCFDKDSNRIELPEFTDGTEKITASSIRYNFKTEKGYIEELSIRQDEIYLHMGIAKRHPNDEIHFKGGRFTTCDLEEPHYHFQLSRAIMIPDERIVTGPMNLWVKGVPTPIGFPFSVIPQQKERTHGVLFPELVPLSAYGFGVQNLGYFIPINDRIQTSPYINLYSRGSWGLRNNLQYAKRYGYTGNLDVGFQQFRLGFPSELKPTKISVAWTHRMEPKANPYWNFSSNVNFISDNQSKNNLDPLNPDYFNNSFNSDINLNRNFPGKPVTMGLKTSIRQNSLTKNISLISPVYNLNVTRVFPFKKFIKGTKEWQQIFSRLGVTYSLEGQNRSTFGDSLLQAGNFAAISQQFINGFNQQIGIQTTAGLFKGAFKLTPSLSYANKINFQQINKSFNSLSNSIVTDTLQQTGMLHDLSFNAQMTSVLYSYYRFVGKRRPELRHLMTPSVGFRYTPQLNELKEFSTPDQVVEYNPFERSLYNGYMGKTTSALTFGINNTFEMKFKSDKDTVSGKRKIRIIDALSITGSYDFMRDSMNLSDLGLNLRISPIEWFNFVASSTFSPYHWIDSTGNSTGEFALVYGNLGRFLRSDLTSTITITSKESREQLNSTKTRINENWNADHNMYALHPEFLVDFAIPWKASLSHVYSIFANTSKVNADDLDYISIQTLMINGDISFTKRWKISAIINTDLKEQQVTNARIALSRDLHCWALSVNWTPVGGNKSFLMSIRNTSSMFQDAKFDIRKPPVFL